MRLAKTLSLFCAAILMTGCSSGNKEEKLVSDFLNKNLKENNIPRTIATMSEKDNVDFYIKEFNLSKWFDIDKIVYSDGTIPGKPAPDIYIIAAQKLGLKPEDCIVIEDAISGINSAKNAGIGKVIAIASMESPKFYEKLGVDEIITDFQNYQEILK